MSNVCVLYVCVFLCVFFFCNFPIKSQGLEKKIPRIVREQTLSELLGGYVRPAQLF